MAKTGRGRKVSRGKRERFRSAVLERDRVCRCVDPNCEHGEAACPQPSEAVIYAPLPREAVIAAGGELPHVGPGVCLACAERWARRQQEEQPEDPSARLATLYALGKLL